MKIDELKTLFGELGVEMEHDGGNLVATIRNTNVDDCTFKIYSGSDGEIYDIQAIDWLCWREDG